ncbi:protein DCL, chloroplastic isoform X1 [Cinnamomum micranthum f. kanehirae]|uniref:Protein DCL, chloroplastic isoform X1 n=1 Tax=Cinnamomum micranthum f. kanehirae TaxID=337451 RepID=A0A3S3P2D4_9MAGN|nr:protein DCL, chloroplastic isoform X1 [Cinnamomum micranthum f. kanehirae]
MSSSSAAVALLFARGIPLLPLRLRRIQPSALFLFPSLGRTSLCTATDSYEKVASSASDSTAVCSSKDPSQYFRSDHPDYRRWKDKEEEILKDIEPITFHIKQILHSTRYKDGELLTAEDEKAVEKLLVHHPHSEDKIGCGLNSIMVDRHPQFKNSRCLFVVRTDGGWIDFSYQKCLRAYIRKKYPAYAERFIRENFKRGSS